MAPQYKLTYFNLTGLGEPIRYIFAYGKIDFEDNRIDMGDWGKHKSGTPYGKLPILEIDGKEITQSSAICRYLAKQAGILGKTDLDALQADMIVDTITDLRLNYTAWFRGAVHLVESGDLSSYDSSVAFEPSATFSEPNDTSHTSDSETRRWQIRKKRTAPWRLYIYVKRHLASPPSHLFNTTTFNDSEFALLSHNEKIMALDLFGNDIAEKSTLEIMKLVESSEFCIYNAPFGNVEAYYYNVEESLLYMRDLLKYQFGEEEVIKSFVKNLFAVCERSYPKRNCLMVVSPPNGGKNFFFDAIIHAFLVFGMIGNFGKHSQFPLQECCHKRILLWNEPNCEPSAFDTLKMLFGGDTMSIKVKYKHDSVISRTPIIILTNKDIFPKDLAFRTRMFVYYWKTCPPLKTLRKKLHPMATYYLFENYHCFTDNVTIDSGEEYE